MKTISAVFCALRALADNVRRHSPFRRTRRVLRGPGRPRPPGYAGDRRRAPRRISHGCELGGEVAHNGRFADAALTAGDRDDGHRTYYRRKLAEQADGAGRGRFASRIGGFGMPARCRRKGGSCLGGLPGTSIGLGYEAGTSRPLDSFRVDESVNALLPLPLIEVRRSEKLLYSGLYGL